MTVFTYSAPVGGPEARDKHDRLLRLWGHYWFCAGFRAHIERPKGLPHENRGLFKAVREAFAKAPTVNSRDYELACWIRWAYAANFAQAIDGPILCVDSDVFPHPGRLFTHRFFNATRSFWVENDPFPTFLEPDEVPCAVLGNAAQLTRLTQELVARMPTLRDKAQAYPHVSDQTVCQQLGLEGEVLVALDGRKQPVCRNFPDVLDGEEPALLHIKTDFCNAHHPGTPKHEVVRMLLPPPKRSRPA